VLFAEKYASAWNADYQGGCHWGYFQADCRNSLFAYHEPSRNAGMPPTDPNGVGAREVAFQIRPNAAGGCNPCLPATGHASMNACMADASVRPLSGDVDRLAWWALVTPRGEVE
jgi:hypothetical protein